MVTTWEKPVIITQKDTIKKSKHTDTKISKHTKKDSTSLWNWALKLSSLSPEPTLLFTDPYSCSIAILCSQEAAQRHLDVP